MESEHAPRTIPEALTATATRFGDNDALVDHSGPEPVRLTYRELHDSVRTLADALLAHGIRRGDRVAINVPNTHHWVLAALATLHIGAVLVPINTRYTSTETIDLLHRSEASVLFVADRFLGRERLAELAKSATADVPGALRTVVRVPVGGEASRQTEQSSEPQAAWDVLDWSALQEPQRYQAAAVDEHAASVHPDHVSDILFTSGTTGRSKGVLSAHRQALAVAQSWADNGPLSAADRYLAVNPFFHSFGYKAGILPCLLSGATLVPLPVFDADRALELITRERISVLPGPPNLYESIMDSQGFAEADLSCLRLAVTGAASVPAALVERLRSVMTVSSVLTAYGLTEAVVATMCRPEDGTQTITRTCGRPTAGFELRIANADGTAVDQGGVGEVMLRGPNAMLGYLDDPEATRAAFDHDGWLHTGDLGRVDEHGNLSITDRLKDMYISGGFNVYPAEVEHTLARLDGVLDSAVIGIPDPRQGEVGKAYVVRRREHEFSAEEVLAFCAEHLAKYKVPRHVEFRDELPRNSAGKIVKQSLRTAGASSGKAAGPAADDTPS